MTTRQTEIRMMWLVLLIMIGVGAWFFDIKSISYMCGLGFVLSVMLYVSDVQLRAQQLPGAAPIPLTSKLPLYIASILSLIGMLLDQGLIIGLGLSAWIYYFLKWLRRLEVYLLQLQQRGSVSTTDQLVAPFGDAPVADQSMKVASTEDANLWTHLKSWFVQGNPVLKVAIVTLLIGVVLLLRFAVEQWQMSLTTKLAMVYAASAAVVGFGIWLARRNRSFGIALQGLGLAGLFLSLLFSQHYGVIGVPLYVAVIFFALMALAIYLSVSQHSLELATMALVVAYIAPFTLPEPVENAVWMLGYFLLVNVVMAFISSIRPWKYLNQMTLLLTVVVGGGYSFIYGTNEQQHHLAMFVIAHSALFIYLGWRYSQLQQRSTQTAISLAERMDEALIVLVPIIAFAALYVLYLDQPTWQAIWSAMYAGVYALLYVWLKHNAQFQRLRHYYLAVAIIFVAMLPAILLPTVLAMLVWALESLALMVYALSKQQRLAQRLSHVFAAMAVFTLLYHISKGQPFPALSMLGMAALFSLTVIGSHFTAVHRAQLSIGSLAFQAIQMLSVTLLAAIGLLEQIEHPYQVMMVLLILTGIWCCINELMLGRPVTVAWGWIRSFGLLPIYISIIFMLFDLTQHGQVMFESDINRFGMLIVGLVLAVIALRSQPWFAELREILVLSLWTALAVASVCSWPTAAWTSVTLLPLLLLGYWAWTHSALYTEVGQSYSSLVLFGAWLVLSQLLSEQAFIGYLLPILNPFDIASIAMWIAIWAILRVQLQAQRDLSWIAIAMVLSLLWLSSYVLLRALHVYLDTPYNSLEIWSNSTIQFSLTVLWVTLAGLTMIVASQRQLRQLWILGSSILVLVSLKLVLIDLAQIAAILRVLSFLIAGAMMLGIAYLAPLPGTAGSAKTPSDRK